MKPTKYDMRSKEDIIRWFNEMENYLKCGKEIGADFVNQGTDREGRKYAYDGFLQLKDIFLTALPFFSKNMRRKPGENMCSGFGQKE